MASGVQYADHMTPENSTREPAAVSADTGTEWFEIERKYEVAIDAVLPLDYSSRGYVAAPPVTFELVASYYDTPARDLATHRLALRHRIGGPDAGWHLKERGADGTIERSWPGSAEIPEGVTQVLRERFGESLAELSPTATLRTTRTSIRLSDRDGADAIEIVDDRVHAFDHIEEVERAWREWEAELAEGADQTHLDAVEALLLDAGAAHSLSESKIGRTLGKSLELAERHGAAPRELASLAITDVADRLAARPLADEGAVALLRILARSVLT